MRRFAIMKPVRACTFYAPVQTGFESFILQDPFCEGATANVSKAHHQNFHGGKDSMQLAVCSLQSSFPNYKLKTAYCRLPVANSSLWIFSRHASNPKSIAMTNKEILHADLLDILFENRNKAYGAYALRRNYNHRLQWAIGTSLGIALILSILGYSPIKDSRNPYKMNKKEMKISSVGPIDAKKVEAPKPKIEPPRKEIAYTKIKIVPSDTKTDMPDLKDIL